MLIHGRGFPLEKAPYPQGTAAWLCKPEGSTAAEAEIRQFWPQQQKHSALPFTLPVPTAAGTGWWEGLVSVPEPCWKEVVRPDRREVGAGKHGLVSRRLWLSSPQPQVC